MSYYTIAHLLQGDLFGEKVGTLGITADCMTPEVYDYIFLEGAYPEGCKIEQEKLDIMKREFNYWYPYDLRVSGKDLIKNHLMMSLYNHQAIWTDMTKMPHSYFCNGHIQLNNEKMSKSTGNFLTVDDAIQQFGADATRFACADAGDRYFLIIVGLEIVWMMPTSLLLLPMLLFFPSPPKKTSFNPSSPENWLPLKRSPKNSTSS